MKHEWNAWLAWSPLASQLRELDAGLGVVTAMDVLIFTVDSRLLFPLHLYFAKMPEAGPSDQEWRRICRRLRGQEETPLRKDRVRACIQIVSAACQHVVAIRTCPRHRNSAPADVFGASDLPPTTGDFLWVSGMCTVSPTCVSTESVSWCALITSLSVVQITKLIFIYFHESKQAKAAHTNKLRLVKKRKEKNRTEEWGEVHQST